MPSLSPKTWTPTRKSSSRVDLPKLEELTDEQRKELYDKNFEEISTLRHNVYSRLNIWPGNTFLPVKINGSKKPSYKQDLQQHQHQQQQQLQQKRQQQQQQQQRQHEHQQMQQQQKKQNQQKVQPQQARDETSMDWNKDLVENINIYNRPTSTLSSYPILDGVAKATISSEGAAAASVDSSDDEFPSFSEQDLEDMDYEQF
ncbi:hypothetical protein ElyMa_003937500 [Elysia marginata]|uniref:Uncharacterized protein n=1 Tax=Elysia marginata TaxID=1093978 RepID=A0AAV4FSP3_9GAST|nr:hypothetical protein ElyMa_003937500 [Elysia marginata]